MAEAQLDQAIVEKRSKAALAYQLNFLFPNVNQFLKKDQDFFLSNNVDQTWKEEK